MRPQLPVLLPYICGKCLHAFASVGIFRMHAARSKTGCRGQTPILRTEYNKHLRNTGQSSCLFLSNICLLT
jgi:hypothetical protein